MGATTSGPRHQQPIYYVHVDASEQMAASAESAADGGPSLPGVIVGDEPVALGGAIQRSLDGVPLQCAPSRVGGRAVAGAVTRRRGRAE